MNKILIATLVGLCITVSSCGTTRNPASDYRDGFLTDDELNNTRSPGTLKIKRHTKNYSMEMVLDISEDNIYFMMDQEEAKNILDNIRTPSEEGEVALDEIKTDPQSIAKSGKHIVYAQSYLYEKKYQRALQEVNQAIDLNESSSTAYQLKGSIFYRLNDFNEAKKNWNKALIIDPTLDDVRFFLKKMEETKPEGNK